jgi:hypothetical protein
MQPIRIMQIGLGPLGRKITQFLIERPAFRIVATADTDPGLAGRPLGEVCGQPGLDLPICRSLREAVRDGNPQVAILTTVSDMARITP